MGKYPSGVDILDELISLSEFLEPHPLKTKKTKFKAYHRVPHSRQQQRPPKKILEKIVIRESV
jgi:hypothetical protein